MKFFLPKNNMAAVALSVFGTLSTLIKHVMSTTAILAMLEKLVPPVGDLLKQSSDKMGQWYSANAMDKVSYY